MTWYAAHVIVYDRFLDGPQDEYPVYENVLLIEAESPDAAWIEAERLGAEYSVDDSVDSAEAVAEILGVSSGLMYKDHPVAQTYAGVRKVLECAYTASRLIEDPDADNATFQPSHNSEITYSALVTTSAEDLRRLATSQPVTLLYRE